MYVVETAIVFLVLKEKRKFWGNCYSMCSDILLFPVTKLFIFLQILCTVLALAIFNSPFVHLPISSISFVILFLPFFSLLDFSSFQNYVLAGSGENGEICALEKLIYK